MRFLQRLGSIRAKLGSTIVFAVVVTLAVIYVLFAWALRNSQTEADYLKLMATANRAASAQLRNPPSGVTTLYLNADGYFEGTAPTELPPEFFDGRSHWGVNDTIVYAAVPKVIEGKQIATIYAYRDAPPRGWVGGFAKTARFLRDYRWQLLAAGAIAAGIALVFSRWLARGMTQPLRDMAAAASLMAKGEYGQRVTTTSRDEVGRLAQAFNLMAADLESVERQRRDLVANAAHELKTPIAAMRAHLENLLDGVEQPDPKTLQVMLGQAERLGRLVEQLLDLSRLESGDLPLRRGRLPLPPLVDQVISEIGVARGDRNVNVTNGIGDDLPPVIADRERVAQVVFNLLDNAVRFTAPGGSVTVTAEGHGGVVQVRVADTGVGIPAEHLPRVFERFYRVDSARSRDEGGTGIGLAIARSVVEAHGGRIWAESRPGRGSDFVFELPAAAPRAESDRSGTPDVTNGRTNDADGRVGPQVKPRARRDA
ncbi:MAG: HAMP domain-containing sensor histidine kinase [Actinomycetota bacterium]